MIIAMFLAHLFGDYVLQWNSLAAWKSREVKGALVHGLIVWAVTWLFALPFEPLWSGVFFIGLTHLLIDGLQARYKPPVSPLLRFVIDQFLHLSIILIALDKGGYLEIASLTADVQTGLRNERFLAYLLGYAFITMPAWVLVKFTAYGLIKGSAPNFMEGTNKYIGIMERLLMTTFVALGQFLLVPLVAVPRLALDWRKIAGSDQTTVYLAELLASVALAVIIGLGLRGL
jgi:hypothetical protein